MTQTSNQQTPIISGVDLYDIMMWEIEPCLTSDRIEETKNELSKLTDAEKEEELQRFCQAFILCEEAMEEVHQDLEYEGSIWRRVLTKKAQELNKEENNQALNTIIDSIEQSS